MSLKLHHIEMVIVEIKPDPSRALKDTWTVVEEEKLWDSNGLEQLTDDIELDYQIAAYDNGMTAVTKNNNNKDT